MSLLDDMEKEQSGASLLDELGNTPEETKEYTESVPWMPDAGDGIEGVVLERFSFESKYKDAKTGTFPTIPGMVLKLDDDDDAWSVVGLHGVLRDLINEKDPQPGDRVAVIYSGEREGKEYSYKHYRMAVRRGGGGKPVPAQAKSPEDSGSRSTQHEPAKKAAPAKRKPGQKAATDDSDKPPF